MLNTVHAKLRRPVDSVDVQTPGSVRRQMKSLQKFASVHASLHNHFASDRHLIDRQTYKLSRLGRVAIAHGLKNALPCPNRAERRIVAISLTTPASAIETGIAHRKLGTSSNETPSFAQVRFGVSYFRRFRSAMTARFSSASA